MLDTDPFIPKMLEAFEILYGILFPFAFLGLIIGIIYAMVKFPISILFFGILLLPHLVCNYFIKRYKNLKREDAFVGGEKL